MSKNRQAIFALEERIEGVTRKMNEVTHGAMSAMVMRLDFVSPVGDIKLWSDPSKAPKNYRGGQFRGNWQLGVNNKPTRILYGRIDPSGVNTVAHNIGLIPVMASRGYKFYLVNNLPYALVLEQGHSTQAPRAFIYRVKREFNGIVRGIVADIKSRGGRTK